MHEPSTPSDNMTPLQRAAHTVLDLRTRLNAVEHARTEPIAIVGVDVRFPGGAESAEAFWDLLESGRDGVGPVPAERWDSDAYYDSNRRTPGKAYCREGGFIDGVDRFDAAFFGIPPREAASMDPQHRLLLETAWRALEHAGIAPDSLAETPAGVFIGICSNDYELLTLSRGAADAFFLSGTRPHAAAGRISHTLGLRGPSMVFDTACSSSLVAVHEACQSLRNDECTLALAAGVNLMLMPEGMVILCQAEMLSADGRCKTCDSSGDGYGRGEGVGVVVLKRLSKAEADGDNILAVILGSAVNHDGMSSGMTVPSATAQQEVIARALKNAGVEATDVDYVEMHGTGTPLGDPIEVRSLAAVHAEDRALDRPLFIGAVKSNIGHLEGAAGVAALTKVTGCLHRGRIMGNLHFGAPNPAIDWAALPVRVASKTQDWPGRTEERRIAGVSAFGASGTNAHMIVASAPDRADEEITPAVSGEERLFVLSARDEDGLRRQAGLFADRLRNLPDALWPDAAARAAIGRAQLPQRLAFTAASAEEAADLLRAYADGRTDQRIKTGRADATAPMIGARLPAQGGEKLIGTLRGWGLDAEPMATHDGADFDHVIDLADAEDDLLDAVGKAFVAGCRPDWRAVHAPCPRRWVDLPLTAFAGERHWLPDTDISKTAMPVAAPGETGQAAALPTSAPLSQLFERQIEETAATLQSIVRQQLDHLRAGPTAAIAPEAPAPGRSIADWQILAVSARDEAGLEAALTELSQALARNPAAAWNRHAGRPFGEGGESAVLVVRDAEDAKGLLSGVDKPRRLWRGRRPLETVRPVFMLSGIGDHYPGLAGGLMDRWPDFRATVEDCLQRVDPEFAAAMKTLMTATPAPEAPAKGPDLKAMLGRGKTAKSEGPPVAQVHVLVFIVEYALARLLMSFGIEPAALAGYSLGDYVAAVLSGVMTLDDALTVVAARGRLIDGLEEGGMLAVMTSAEEITPILTEGVDLAVAATPSMSIAAGSEAALKGFEAELRKRDMLSRRLGVRRAFHTRAMTPIESPFRKVFDGIALNPPERPFVSGTTGNWITVEEAVDPGFWVRHSLNPVRWRDVTSTLRAAGHELFVEIGPGNSLGSFVMQQEGTDAVKVFQTMRGADEPQDDAPMLLGAAARLWLSGGDVAWPAIGGTP